MPQRGCPPWGPCRITRRFQRLSGGQGLVAYALRTRPPLSGPRRAPPVRLACIRPAASVHPEPGSNSSLYYCPVFLISVSPAPPSLSCPSLKGSLSGPAASRLTPDRNLLVLASSYQRTPPQCLLCLTPLSLDCGLQKYNLSPYRQCFFSTIFHYPGKRLEISLENFQERRPRCVTITTPDALPRLVGEHTLLIYVAYRT